MSDVNVSSLLRTQHCLPKLKGGTREEVVEELIRTFVASGALAEDAAPTLYGEVLAREDEGTTGIGKGVAMPHARGTETVPSSMVAVGLHEEGIDFDATDGAPVHIVFLIASTDSQEYLQVARQIARVARDDVEMRALRRQTTKKAIVSFLKESWSQPAAS